MDLNKEGRITPGTIVFKTDIGLDQAETNTWVYVRYNYLKSKEYGSK